MIKLSPRLDTISKEILKGETMADIGTDHGFLPIYLWEKGISPHVVLTDISPGSLKKASDNCLKLYPETKFDLRLGAGLTVLKEQEVDAVVIAGMGGLLMAEILDNDLEKSLSYKKIILQPRNNVGPLRFWLYNNGFRINNEQLVEEGRFICEIITAVPKEIAIPNGMTKEDIEWEFPLSLIDFQNHLTIPYLINKRKKEELILESMGKAHSTKFYEIRKQKYRISYIDYLLRRLKDEN